MITSKNEKMEKKNQTQNDSLKQLADVLRNAQRILLFPHINIDGDAAGSSVALCRALRKSGKQAWVLLEEEMPGYLKFLDEEDFCIIDSSGLPEQDVSFAVDCSDIQRLGERKAAFERGNRILCLDHHISNAAFADISYIDSNSASCAELAYLLINELEIEIDTDMAECLYAGIITDTGNFQYSNVKASTHLITADLFEKGLNHERAIIEIYQTVSAEKIQLKSLALQHMKFFAGGRGVISFVTQDMLRKSGAELSDAEGIVETLRNIAGIEIAIVLKEQENGGIKATMRAKSTGNVEEIAASFGGGGHIRAAGCTILRPIAEAEMLLKEAAEEQLRRI
ncbi:MAG: bifunctional oligoribonuclease/PAP phosphatase NrnA [Firmicutes bacterium]|nr:bifunctional oligoribonuclease/PAP phosphatase NrnA [Bacillota bacterium]